jgi:LuxR family maltose regulon positive regulatory protein
MALPAGTLPLVFWARSSVDWWGWRDVLMPGKGAALAAASPELAMPGAGVPVLVPKILLPVLPGWMVRRRRLERLMSAGTQGRLTVVTGPPGAGKTMAVASWAAARRGAGPLAWVSLDGFDNDPAILWACVLEALRRAGAAVPAGLPAPTASGPARGMFLRRLASWLAGLDPAVVLVLDDLHLLTGPAVLEGLAYVLAHAGTGLRLVATSRMDPLLPLHRNRLAGYAKGRTQPAAHRPPASSPYRC